MSALQERLYLTAEEYLEFEKSSPVRHEYVDGEIYAMSGGSDAHGTIIFNLTGLLHHPLRGSPCHGYAGNIKVRIEPANVYYYPDLFVTCDERDRAFDGEKHYPCLVIEVLSPTTEAVDRGEKSRHYRQIPTLQEYVLVRQDAPAVEFYRRGAEGLWVLQEYEESDAVPFQSIGVELPIDEIYEGVNFAGGITPRPAARRDVVG